MDPGGQVRAAAGDERYAFVQFFGSFCQLFRAAVHGGGAVIEGDGGVFDLPYLRHQFLVVDVDGEIHADAVDADAFHFKIGDIGGDGVFLFIAGEENIGELFVLSHIGHGGAVGDDVFTFFGVQRHCRLQGAAVEKAAVAGGVLTETEVDFNFSGFPCQLFRGDFFAVQGVANIYIPRQITAFHGAFVIKAFRIGGNGDFIAALAELIGGVENFDFGIVAVIDNVAAGKDVDHINAADIAVGVGIGVNHFFFFGGRFIGHGKGGNAGDKDQCRGENNECDAFAVFHGCRPPLGS